MGKIGFDLICAGGNGHCTQSQMVPDNGVLCGAIGRFRDWDGVLIKLADSYLSLSVPHQLHYVIAGCAS